MRFSGLSRRPRQGEAVRASEEPVEKFETHAGRQGQVDVADFQLLWGLRHVLVVVLGYSRLMWLRY